MTSLLVATCTCRANGWFPFPLFPLFFVPLWILLFVFLTRRWRGGWSRQTGESVLSERYARGEIDEAEFISRRNVLKRKD